VSGTVWVDVEDLFVHAETGGGLSGIQRLNLEICRALVEGDSAPARVRFVRHRPGPVGFEVVTWPAVLALAEKMGRPRAARTQVPGRWREVARRQADALAALGRLLRVIGGLVVRKGPTPPGQDVFAAAVRRGDKLLALGSPWIAGYAARVQAAIETHGVRFGAMIADIVPLRHPEWCHHSLAAAFRAWFSGTVPLAEFLFAISRATADDVTRYAAEQGMRLRNPVRPVPMGTGFTPPASTARARAGLRKLPEPGSYALFVSTLEPRKNHELLFRVWQFLLRERKREDVPKLVFAGRVGWMVAGLMEQMRATHFLDGHIILVNGPDDAELEALYRGCLFTLFPAWMEGWGLPVTESLMLGKPCIASCTTSLPEAGGTLARYFDPENLHDAMRVIGDAIADREGLRAWEAQVRREFRPVPWSETARAILSAFDVTPEVAR
jgi:glycosyltransferase involved in cell wall biosynthesis